VSICIAHRRVHASNALCVTNRSRLPHGRRVQPADTGWHSGRLGSPVSCTKVPTFVTHVNELLLILPSHWGWKAEST